MDKIIDRISQTLPEISSAEEAGPEYDELKTDTSFLSAPAPLKKSIDFGESLKTGDAIFQKKELLKEPDDLSKLQWSSILALV